MDKLDKVPSKDVKRIRDNPIAQGIVSNTIFQVAWNGVSAVIGWIVGHYALLGGVPLYWAILMGAVVFFLIALSYNLFKRGREAKLVSAAANANLNGETDSEAIERIGNQHDQLQGELHLAEREIATLKGEKGRLTREIAKLERSLESSQRELSDAKADLESQQAARTGVSIERNMLKEQLEQVEKALKEERKRANYESNQREEFIKLYYESERKLGDLRWLQDRMKYQAENLDTWVRIKKANRVKLQLTKTPRMVVLAFWVKNESIFTVTFNLKLLSGRLRFKGESLHDPIRLSKRSNPIEDLEPGASIEIILVQPLLRTEAETILEARQNGDPNAIFSLDDLTIPLCVRNIPQPVAATRLKIYSEIEHMEASDFPCDINVDDPDFS